METANKERLTNGSKSSNAAGAAVKTWTEAVAVAI